MKARHQRERDAMDKKIEREKEHINRQKEFDKNKKEQEQRKKEIEKKRKEQQRKQNKSKTDYAYQSFVKDSMTITEMNRLLDEWLSQL